MDENKEITCQTCGRKFKLYQADQLGTLLGTSKKPDDGKLCCPGCRAVIPEEEVNPHEKERQG